MTAEVSWPVLRTGSEGPHVTALQYLLRCARDQWRDLAADGVFGTATESVVKGFQDLTGLTIDGIVGPRTWTKLTDGVAFGSTVRLGSTGECVKAAQTELLRHRRIGPDDVDGVFGPDTEGAIRSFQKDVGLTMDGIVGPKTWKDLVSRPAL